MEKENRYRRNIKIMITLSGIFALLFVGYLLYDLITFREFKTFYECKMFYWEEKCRLIVDDYMCWKLESNNDTKYSNCQVITEKQKKCWQEGLTFCNMYEFVNSAGDKNETG